MIDDDVSLAQFVFGIVAMAMAVAVGPHSPRVRFSRTDKAGRLAFGESAANIAAAATATTKQRRQ